MHRLKLIFCLMALLPWAINRAAAQTCTEWESLSEIENLCEDTPSGEACRAGEKFALAELDALTTEADEVLILSIPTAENPIRVAVFGEARVENAVENALEELPTLAARNAVGYDVNMREGAGANFPLAGTFSYNIETLADGRTADGTWIRVQTATGSAWVSRDLVRLGGEASTLAVVDSPYTAAYQAMRIRALGCAGVLIQYSGENAAQLQINGADLTLQAGVLVVQADEDSTRLNVLEAQVALRAEGQIITAQKGQTLQISAGSAPQILPAYPFEVVATVPIGLVSEDGLACIAGVDSAEIASYQAPAPEATLSQNLDPAAHYAITGYAADESGALWWQVQSGAWVRQDEVRTAGLCDKVIEVDPAVNFSAAPTSSDGSGVNVSAILAGRSIWQANSGNENQSGTCTYPPVALCEHLVAITPNPDGTIAWRGQEVEAYTMFPEGDNFFGYSGRNKLNNANLTMGLIFTSEGGWRMTMTQVFDNDPQCIRTFYYTATRNW